MTPKTNTEVAGCLLDGVTADIWTDAHECTDQIAQTQDAMAEAAHRLGQMDELVSALEACHNAMFPQSSDDEWTSADDLWGGWHD